MEHKERRTDYRKHALQAAKELYYGDDILEQIRAAKDENQIEQIMNRARKQRL